MNRGKLTFCAPVALMRRSMSACISSQIAYPHGRMTMVPRAGPFSASSARATTSWYHWGKSFPWGVSTACLATVGGLLDVRRADSGSLPARPDREQRDLAASRTHARRCQGVRVAWRAHERQPRHGGRVALLALGWCARFGLLVRAIGAGQNSALVRSLR